MIEFDCPSCDCICEVETEDLPEHAIDSFDYECDGCGVVMQLGWEPAIEIRAIQQPQGGEDEPT